MVNSKQADFAARFEKLRGGMSYQALSDAIYRRTGIRVSPQAMHKWSKGGAITAQNVKLLAEFFGVREAWLLLGEGPEPAGSVDTLINALPEDRAQATLDFLEYQFDRSEGMIASDKLADYMKMIDGIRRDMDKRRDEDGHK